MPIISYECLVIIILSERSVNVKSRERLKEMLEPLTPEEALYLKKDRVRIICFAGNHRFVIPEGRQRICKVCFNTVGSGCVSHTGYVSGLECDPTEKKPFYTFSTRFEYPHLRYAGL